MLRDEAGEIVRLPHILLDQLREDVEAVRLERHPNFQSPEAARELHAALGEGEAARRDAPVERCEIRRVHHEGGAMRALIANQRTTHLIGQVHPLVQIECDRVGLLESRDQVPQGRSDSGQCAERAIDVKPEVLVLADRRQRVQIVRRAGIDRSRVADNADGPPAGRAIRRQDLPQCGQVDPVIGADRNTAQCLVTESE